MAYSRLGSVTSSGVITKTWGDGVDTNFEALKPRQVSLYPHGTVGDFSDDAVGSHFAVKAGSNTSAGTLSFDEWMVPSDFQTLTKAVIRGMSGEDGNMYFSVGTAINVMGSSFTGAETGFGNTTTLAVNALRYFEMDVSAYLPSSALAPDQTVSLWIRRIANSSLDTIDRMWIFGAYILYTP